MLGGCIWHAASLPFLLILGKKRFSFSLKCLCLHFSTGSNSEPSPGFCNNLLSVEWVSLRGAVRWHPSGGSDMSSELIAALCCFYHLGIFRVVEPYTPRTIIRKQRNPHAFLYLQGLCFSVRTCPCASRDAWNWNRVPLPSRDNIFVSKYLLFICLFIYVRT